MRASLSTWRLLAGTAAEDIDRAVAHHLASFPPKGLVGAFSVRTGPEEVTVMVVNGGEKRMCWRAWPRGSPGAPSAVSSRSDRPKTSSRWPMRDGSPSASPQSL